MTISQGVQTCDILKNLPGLYRKYSLPSNYLLTSISVYLFFYSKKLYIFMALRYHNFLYGYQSQSLFQFYLSIRKNCYFFFVIEYI